MFRTVLDAFNSSLLFVPEEVQTVMEAILIQFRLHALCEVFVLHTVFSSNLIVAR